MMGPRVWTLVAMIAGTAACGKADGGAGASVGVGGGAGASVGVDSGAAAAGSADSGAAAAAMAGAKATTAWKGAYKSVESVITLPPGVKWRVPETTVGVGDGTIALTIDPAGRVHGTLDGVLGPATIDGLASNGRLTASVLRKDPTDHGFIGTLGGDLADAAVHGTIQMALADTSAVRQATFDLAPEAAR